jgi:DNA-binding CsgD family transcriptional regulator
VRGEAGAGKSTLWRAGVAAAADAGHRLLRSEPSQSEADLSFAGLTDLLAGVLPAAVAELPDPQREALEVALLLRPAGNAPPTSRAVGVAVLTVLRACVSEGPVLVAIDDVHWLDEASLDALAFAVRRISDGPLSLLIAARSEASADPLTLGTPPPSRRWNDLLRVLPAAEVLDLAPLDMWQIQNLLPTVTAARARVVARQSRGNPFWALEIAASLDSSADPLPALARSLASRVCRSLSADTAEALTAVAAAGRIGVAEIVTVLDDLDDPASALDAAVMAGMVTESEGRVAVAHPLIGAAAVQALPPGRRAQLYRRLAEVLSGPERYAHFAALAAGPGPDAGVAEALDSAAEAAYAHAGNAAAAQFAAQAVAYTPGADGGRLARRLIRAGELLFLAGDVERSLEHLRRLDLGALTTEDLERALPLLADMTDLAGDTAKATAIVTHAVDTAGPDPRRRALVLSLASDIAYGVRGGRRAAAAEAIRNAEAAGPAADATLHRALINLVEAKVIAAEGLDSAILDRAEALEGHVSIQRLYDTADLHRGLWSRYVERLDTARAAIRRCITRARDADEDYALATFLAYLADTEELAGDYTAAAEAVRAADEAAAWHDWPPSPWLLEPRCELLIAAGDLDGAVRLVGEQLPDSEGSRPASRFMAAGVRGRASMWRGDAAAALRHFERAAACADESDWADPAVRGRIDPALGEAYVAVGRPEEASLIAARLREIGERLRRPALIGDAARIDCLVAARAGDLDSAAELAQSAVTAHGLSPLRLELARSLLTLGRIERRRKARKQSRDALRRALELATGIGHRPLLAEIERELPRLAAARAGDELTATERRVADLIAAGATNREAADALFVSVRTIETHVASIYRKLGVRTRAELARKLPGPAAR